MAVTIEDAFKTDNNTITGLKKDNGFSIFKKYIETDKNNNCILKYGNTTYQIDKKMQEKAKEAVNSTEETQNNELPKISNAFDTKKNDEKTFITNIKDNKYISVFAKNIKEDDDGKYIEEDGTKYYLSKQVRNLFDDKKSKDPNDLYEIKSLKDDFEKLGRSYAFQIISNVTGGKMKGGLAGKIDIKKFDNVFDEDTIMMRYNKLFKNFNISDEVLKDNLDIFKMAEYMAAVAAYYELKNEKKLSGDVDYIEGDEKNPTKYNTDVIKKDKATKPVYENYNGQLLDALDKGIQDGNKECRELNKGDGGSVKDPITGEEVRVAKAGLVSKGLKAAGGAVADVLGLSNGQDIYSRMFRALAGALTSQGGVKGVLNRLKTMGKNGALPPNVIKSAEGSAKSNEKISNNLKKGADPNTDLDKRQNFIKKLYQEIKKDKKLATNINKMRTTAQIKLTPNDSVAIQKLVDLAGEKSAAAKQAEGEAEGEQQQKQNASFSWEDVKNQNLMLEYIMEADEETAKADSSNKSEESKPADNNNDNNDNNNNTQNDGEENKEGENNKNQEQNSEEDGSAEKLIKQAYDLATVRVAKILACKNEKQLGTLYNKWKKEVSDFKKNLEEIESLKEPLAELDKILDPYVWISKVCFVLKNQQKQNEGFSKSFCRYLNEQVPFRY